MMRKITVGIDIGTYSTKVVVSEHVKDLETPIIIGTGYAPSEGLRRGYIVNFEEAKKCIQKAVVEAERASKIKIKRAYVSMGGISLESLISHGTSVISRGDGEVTDLDVRKALEESEKAVGDFKNKKILHTVPVRFKRDGKEVFARPSGLKGLRLEVKPLYILCLTQHFEDLVEAVESA